MTKIAYELSDVEKEIILNALENYLGFQTMRKSVFPEHTTSYDKRIKLVKKLIDRLI